MRVLLDTNVLLDALLDRHPWVAEAAEIWRAAGDGRLECCVSASSLTDIHYISRRAADSQTAREIVRQRLDRLTVLPVGASVLDAAWSRAETDFEDAVQIVAATQASVDAIVTRDESGFSGSPVEVLSPDELIDRLSASDSDG